MEKLSDINNLIHDSSVVSYNIDFIKQEMKISLKRDEEGTVTLVFNGLLAHKLENIIRENIIFDIDEMTIDEFIKSEQKNLDEELTYGFPTVEADDISDLKNYLKKYNYTVFIIYSTLGLNGYIIAESINFLIEGEDDLGNR